MCKILVISDVHGRLRDLRWVLQNETADAMFYLGDGLYDLNAALELRRSRCPIPSTAWPATATSTTASRPRGSPLRRGAFLLHPRASLRRQDGQ
ncbi:hypothetical protein NIA69_04505 [Gemmiger formicilis]|nr:hypothetical protein [Gemmiger formicilis]